LIEVVYKCDKCRSRLIGGYIARDKRSIYILCSDCGAEEVLDNLHDYCSPYNKLLLEVLELVKGR
jgi:DNA-directed RNA polymerase subunit RPC12/RpoP